MKKNMLERRKAFGEKKRRADEIFQVKLREDCSTSFDKRPSFCC